jgi:branched-chain amino acid aminotransferase
MGLKIYINGEWLEKENAKISVFDHGLLYGDGVFEGMRTYNGKIFRLRQHLQRLVESGRAIGLEMPMSADEFEKAIYETMKVNGLEEAYVRLVVTRGIGDLGLDPESCGTPEVILIAGKLALYPPELYENGLAVIIAKTRRNLATALNPRLKSLNYLNNILAKREATAAGLKEALMLNADGFVAEATGENIFIVKDGVLETPPTDAGILVGITRQAVMELAEKNGIPVRERRLKPDDIYAAEECFLTGSAAEMAPIVQVDGRPIGTGKPGPVMKKLHQAFRELASSE